MMRVRSAQYDRRSDSGAASAEHVAHSRKGHEAGAHALPHAENNAVPIQAALAGTSRLPGHRDSTPTCGHTGSWMLLASPPLPEWARDPRNAAGILGGEVRCERQARPRSGKNAATRGLARHRGVGVRVERHGAAAQTPSGCPWINLFAAAEASGCPVAPGSVPTWCKRLAARLVVPPEQSPTCDQAGFLESPRSEDPADPIDAFSEGARLAVREASFTGVGPHICTQRIVPMEAWAEAADESDEPAASGGTIDIR